MRRSPSRRPTARPVVQAGLGALLCLSGSAGCGSQAAAPEHPEIILISMDTLRADRLGAYGNPNHITPNLDHLASQSILFEHAYSQATNTAPSHASMFTSRYPPEEDSGDRKPEMAPEMKTLAEVLTAYGWDTAAFVAGGDLSEVMGVGRGFGTWTSSVDFGSLWHTVPMALGWLDGPHKDAPWLLFVHGYDAHGRYLKPTPFGYAFADPAWVGPGQEAVRNSTERLIDGYLHADFRAFGLSSDTELRPRSPEARARLLQDALTGPIPAVKASEADLELVRGVYDGAVAYGDAQLGLFLAALQERGVLDRATIVLFADHGEQLGEDGLFNHCCGVGDGETHVPLLVRLPGGKDGGRRVSGVVELVDIMPTIVELAGAKPPAGIHGQSFAAAIRGEAFAGREVAFSVSEHGARMLGARTLQGRLTYSGGTMSSPLTAELIETAAIPGPSFQATPGMDMTTQESLRKAMAAWLRSLAPSPSARPTALPAALQKELRDHGYFEVGE